MENQPGFAYIYTLAHPLSGDVRYVGKSINPRQRLKNHLRGATMRTRKDYWVRSLLRDGLTPIIEVLDLVPDDEWDFWECYWIAQIKAWGFVLTNGDTGGIGPGRVLESTKRQISATIRAKKIQRPAIWVQYNQYTLAGLYVRSYASCKLATEAVQACSGNLHQAAEKRRAIKGFLWTKGANPPPSVATPYDENGRLPVTEEQRVRARAMHQGNRGRKLTPEHLLALKDAAHKRKGVKSGPKSMEGRQKVSDASTSKKKVIQRTLGGQLVKEWPSQSEAAKFLGVHPSSISAVVSGRERQVGGFTWQRG